jgi:hypothetical protein
MAMPSARYDPVDVPEAGRVTPPTLQSVLTTKLNEAELYNPPDRPATVIV